jgi:hypothetical protein
MADDHSATAESFHAEIALFGKTIAEDTKWKLAVLVIESEDAVDAFAAELKKQARLGGFDVVKKYSNKFKQDDGGVLVHFECSLASAAEVSRERVNPANKKKAKRDRPKIPRSSQKVLEQEDCCLWQVDLRFFLGKGVVQVKTFRNEKHNHAPVDFRSVSLKTADLARDEDAKERIKMMARSGAANTPVIQGLIEVELEEKVEHPVMVARSAIDRISGKGEAERSVTKALKAMVAQNQRVVICAQDANGKHRYLTNVDPDDLGEAVPLNAAEKRALSAARRDQKAGFTARELQRAAEGLRRNDKNLAAAQKAKKSVVKDVVAEDSAAAVTEEEPDASAPLKLGPGNHGSKKYTPVGWTRFTYKDEVLAMLLAVWVPDGAYEDVLKFGWIIIADNGYCTNKYRFPMFNAVTQDNSNKTIQVMKGFLTNERFVSFDVLYRVAFAKLYPPEYLARVRLFVVDGDGQQIQAILAALRLVFVNAVLAACLVHLLQKPLAKLNVGAKNSPADKTKETLHVLLWTAARMSRTQEHFDAMLDIADHTIASLKEEKTFTELAHAVVAKLRATAGWGNYEFSGAYCRISGRTGNPAESMNNVDSNLVNAKFNLVNALAQLSAYHNGRCKRLHFERVAQLRLRTSLGVDDFCREAPAVFTLYAVGQLDAAANAGRGCKVFRVDKGSERPWLVVQRERSGTRKFTSLYPAVVRTAAQSAMESEDEGHVSAAKILLAACDIPFHMLTVVDDDDGCQVLICLCNKFVQCGFPCWAQVGVLLDYDPHLRARKEDAIAMFHKRYTDATAAFEGGVIFPYDFSAYANTKDRFDDESGEVLFEDEVDDPVHKRKSDSSSSGGASIATFGDDALRSPEKKAARRFSHSAAADGDNDSVARYDKAVLASLVHGIAREIDGKDIESLPEYAELCEDMIALSVRFHEAFDRSDLIHETAHRRQMEQRDRNRMQMKRTRKKQ